MRRNLPYLPEATITTRISLSRLLLAPLLLAQGRRLRRTALRLPEPVGHRAGFIHIESTQRVLSLLFVGDSTMLGVGVEHQAAALAAQTAHAVAVGLRRSVQWRLVAESGVTVSQARDLLERSNDPLSEAAPPDVLITALGGNDVIGQTSAQRFLEAYEALLQTVASAASSPLHVISGLPPMHMTPAVPQPLRWFFGSCAHALDARLKAWCRARPDVNFLSLQWAADRTRLSKDRFHPGATLYAVWAQLIAERIVGHFTSSAAGPLPGVV